MILHPKLCCGSCVTGCVDRERFRAQKRRILMVSIGILVVCVILLIVLVVTMGKQQDDIEIKLSNLVSLKQF